MIPKNRRHPNSKRWKLPVLARKATTLTGPAAEQRWLNSATRGPQKPAVVVRHVVHAIPSPWWRAIDAVTSGFF